MSELPADSLFAGYRIERVLGAGGMGTVYLARHPDLPRSEAVKVLSADLSRDPAFRARFLREADVAASLDHPNIVSIHQRGEQNGTLWIAMQYVEGTDADKALEAGTMTAPRAVRIIAEVGEALDYAHHRGVVHRDIKPANILLSELTGSDERVLLTDFGIARALGDIGLTTTGAVMATLAFAAPEVLAGQQFDHRADLYSLGCTLFRLLTGRSPYYQADGAVAVMAAHLHQPPPSVTVLAPWLPPQMDSVIARAMAKDPAERFGTARQLADAAAQALDGRGAPQRSTPTQPWHPNSPPPQPVYQPLPMHFAPAPPKRRFKAIAAIAATVILLAGGVTTWALTSGSASEPPGSNAADAVAETTAGTPAALVPNSALTGLLLPTAEVAEIGGVPELVLQRTLTAIQDDSSSAVDLVECVSPFMPAQYMAYRLADWRAAVEQFLLPPTGSGSIFVQAVVAFPSTDAAETFTRDERLTWSQCAGRTLTATNNGVAIPATFGPLQSVDDNTFAIPVKRPQGFDCQRALGVRNNVVIDVMACRIGVVNQGVDLLQKIALKIPS